MTTPVLDRTRPAVSPATPSVPMVVAALVGWCLLVFGARWWAQELIAERGKDALRLNAAPFVGWEETSFGPATVVALLVGLAGAFALPRLAARVAWPSVLGLTALAAVAWALALAFTDGWAGVSDPLILPGDEYLLEVPGIDSPIEFTRTLVDRLDGFVVHVRSHPPGFVLLLWLLDVLGVGGTGSAATLCVGGGAAAGVAVLVAVREVAGADTARRAAPFVALAPAVIWMATTADAFFAGVTAWAATLVILATGRHGARRDLLAVGGGLLFGVGLLLSYGLVLVGLLPLGVAWSRRALRPLVVGAAAALVVPAVFLALGFSWIEGLNAAREQYEASVASTRPGGFFFVSNLAALAVVVGPAVVVGLVALRDRALWLLVGAALAAVVVANLSGMSKGEVERIWLPFAVWLLPAGAALVARGREAAAAPWLVVQVGVALAVESLLHTRW